METLLLTGEEIARRAQALYENDIRTQVETEGNIGRMITIDVETGNYEFDDEKSRAASERLRARNPNARLFGLRVGYKTAYALGGAMERVHG